jgi:hypothetical protein
MNIVAKDVPRLDRGFFTALRSKWSFWCTEAVAKVGCRLAEPLNVPCAGNIRTPWDSTKEFLSLV